MASDGDPHDRTGLPNLTVAEALMPTADTQMRKSVEGQDQTYQVYFGWKCKEELKREQRRKSNYVTNSMFTGRTWVLKVLFKQFRKPVNVYFLVITLLQFIDGSPKDPFLTTFTLCALILFLVIKDVFEDAPRRKADAEVN